MDVGEKRSAKNDLRERLQQQSSKKIVILIGVVALGLLILTAGLIFIHESRTRTSGMRATKSSTAGITIRGTLNLALAACNPHAQRLQVLVSGKSVYIVRAAGQISSQLQSPTLIGRLIQVDGNPDGTQSICSYGKEAAIPVLKVTKVQQF
jgi:hypothetical protein